MSNGVTALSREKSLNKVSSFSPLSTISHLFGNKRIHAADQSFGQELLSAADYVLPSALDYASVAAEITNLREREVES